VQTNVRMTFQELLHLQSFVGRKIIHDHMNLLSPRLIHHDIGEEGNELRRAMARCRLAQDFAVLVLKAA